MESSGNQLTSVPVGTVASSFNSMGSPINILLRLMVAFTITVCEREASESNRKNKQLLIWGVLRCMDSGLTCLLVIYDRPIKNFCNTFT